MRRARTAPTTAAALAILLLAPVAPQMARGITGTGSHETGTGGEEPQPTTPPPDSPLVPMAVTPAGAPGGGDSAAPTIAGDVPEVVVSFRSDADDLTPDDGNGHADVFVNDEGLVTRVSTDPPGWTVTDVVAGPALSSAGDVVAYGGRLLAPGSEFPVDRIVVTDRRTGTVELAPPARAGGVVGDVAVSPDGTAVTWTQGGDVYLHQLGSGAPDPFLVSRDGSGAPTGGSSHPALCAQGQKVVFATRSPLVVPGDTNGASDVVVVGGLLTADPGDDQVTRISHAHNGGEADGASTEPAITPDCLKVVFTSFATNVVPGDTNATADVFVHDLATGTTTPVTHGNGPSGQGAISDDGGYVAFASAADDLVPGDTNGEDPRGATPTSFQALDRSGRLTYATSVLSVEGPRVRVGFPDTLDFAAVSAGSVDAGAVIDDQILPLVVGDGRSNTNSLATRGPTLFDAKGGVIEPGDHVTDGPDLSFAEVVVDDAGTPDDSEDDVRMGRYCFDERLAGILERDDSTGTEDVATDRFVLLGYNSAVRLRSTTATVEREDPIDGDGGPTACVRARFPAGVEVPRFTGAAVLGGAVADGDGYVNVKGSRPLGRGGSSPEDGDVTGPNLRTAEIEVIGNRVTYTFDDIVVTESLLNEAAVLFAFVDADGRLHAGRSVTTADGDAESVTVEFDVDVDADGVAAAQRFVVLPAAVRNAGGETNVAQSTDGDVAGPELIAVTRVGPVNVPGVPSYDFFFNADVRGADGARFVLYTEDGTGFPVESPTRSSPRVVRVSAPAVERFAASIVLGVAEAGAVFERLVEPDGGEVSGAPNPLGVKGVTARLAPPASMTDGPDLIGVELVGDLHAVDFVFDEPVRDVHLILTATAPNLPTDVLVRELATGDLVRASVDGDDRELAGSSFAPRISRDGRYVVFAHLPRSPDGPERQAVFRRDLIVVRVSPPAIEFGELVAGDGPGEPGRVEIANRGFGRLVIRAVTLSGTHPDDFTISSDRCTGRTLSPKQACVVNVAFDPRSPGSRAGDLAIAARAPRSPRVVSLNGEALPPAPPVAPAPVSLEAPPTVTLSPAVGPPGAVALVRGEGFPRGATIRLGWIPVPASTSTLAPLGPEVEVVADGEGRFGPTPILILSGDVLGPRLAEAYGGQPVVSATAPFLVVPGTVQPGPTSTRMTASFGDTLRTLFVRRVQIVNRR